MHISLGIVRRTIRSFPKIFKKEELLEQALTYISFINSSKSSILLSVALFLMNLSTKSLYNFLNNTSKLDSRSISFNIS